MTWCRLSLCAKSSAFGFEPRPKYGGEDGGCRVAECSRFAGRNCDEELQGTRSESVSERAAVKLTKPLFVDRGQPWIPSSIEQAVVHQSCNQRQKTIL